MWAMIEKLRIRSTSTGQYGEGAPAPSPQTEEREPPLLDAATEGPGRSNQVGAPYTGGTGRSGEDDDLLREARPRPRVTRQWLFPDSPGSNPPEVSTYR